MDQVKEEITKMIADARSEVAETLLDANGVTRKENNGLDVTQERSGGNMFQMSNSLPHVVKPEKRDVRPEEMHLQEFELEETVRIILKASSKLKLSFQTRCKTLLLYHKFKESCAGTEYDPKLVAAACLRLGMKEQGEMNNIIYTFCCILEKEDSKQFFNGKYDNIKESITLMECLILRTLDFYVSYEIAYKYLVYFMYDLHKELSKEVTWDKFVRTCMRLTFDFYLTKKCLLYQADVIAVTMIQVALYFMGIDVNEKDSYLGTWMKALHDACPEDQRRNIIKNIFRVSNVGPVAECEHQKRVEPSSDRPIR